MNTLIKSFAFSALLILAMASATLAQWSPDSSVGTPVTSLASNRYNPVATTDGAGGEIVAWYDYRGTDADIYAQRIDSTGTARWTTNGVIICGATGAQYTSSIISDGLGGAIIAWYDFRGTDGDIYVQKVNASGLVQWTSNGVPVCTATGSQYSPLLATDGAGGAIITWPDFRNTVDYDIYAQRVNASGATQWTTNGVAVCTLSGTQYISDIEADGSGGAILAWYDYRNGTNYEIYAQRLNSSGAKQWGVNDVQVTNIFNKSRYYPLILSDGGGGAILTWYDYRTDTPDIYAQKLNASGATQWTTNGVPICTAPLYQYNAAIVRDGSGGAVIVWYDYRNNTDYDVYAQRVNSAGVTQWTAQGVPICTAAGSQYLGNAGALPDGTGGAIISWTDYRPTDPSGDVYAQHVTGTGAVAWQANGVPVAVAPNSQYGPVLVPSGPGGAIVTYNDSRSGNSNISAAYLSASGKLLPAPKVVSTPPVNVPSGQNLTVTATITASTSITNAVMYYRRGGEGLFFGSAMAKVGGTYQDSVPASYITAKGAEYYIVVTDSVGNVTRAPAAGVIPLQVNLGAPGAVAPGVQPSGTVQTAYRLVSIPIIADNKNPSAVFSASLGAYDNTKWRFFEFLPDQTTVELPGTSNMDPGKAFWLIVGGGGITLTSGSGKTVPTNTRFAVPLNPRWNFIGNPFGFPIPLNKFTIKSGATPDIRYYSGGWATASAALQPFDGVIIANGLPSVDTLYIDPVLTPAPGPSPRQNPAGIAEQRAWTVTIAARAQDAVDNDNAIVGSPAASVGFDALDRPKPPMIGEYVSVDFPHPAWGSVFKYFSTDARPEPKEGDAWQFEVRSNIRDRVDLTFGGVASVPARYQVWLIDNSVKTTANLRVSSTFSFNNADLTQPHQLTVLIGTQKYVSQKLAEFSAMPIAFGLDQNFPNPFNPTTTIRYALPSAGHVTLMVYDVLGQVVRTLIDAVQPQGYQAVEFNASDLASGIYYYRLTVDDPAGGSGSSHQFVQTRKLLLLK